MLIKIAAQIILFVFLCIFLPAFLKIPFKYSILFYLANIFTVFYLVRASMRKNHLRQSEIEGLQEKINILADQNTSELKNQSGLKEKINRYDRLKGVIEEINKNLALESATQSLANLAFSLITEYKSENLSGQKDRGVCILYLIDQPTQTLSIFKSRKADKELIIKAKEGDIFDQWVLRHASPIFIEDTRKDFRFDLEKLKVIDSRPIGSLISSPLISENRFLGILRLDSPQAGFYSLDDLRFLQTISEIGAVAIENGEFFEKTKELAIHDELTALYTKGYFLERLKEELKRCMRHSNPLSLFMIDIDYFKDYNDKFGHAAGDIVLKTLSYNITASLKDFKPLVSRFGGEEFCVILPEINKETAGKIAEGLRGEIEKTKIILRRQESRVTVSIGIAAFPVDSNDENELILKADKAMYAAKEKGRNRVCGAR